MHEHEHEHERAGKSAAKGRSEEEDYDSQRAVPADDGDEAAASEAAASPSAPPPPSLSKSWAISSAHVPSYTGGKVVLCRGGPDGVRPGERTGAVGGRNVDAAAAADDDDDEPRQRRPSPFLLAPCMGDVSIIDAARGIRTGSVLRAASAGGPGDGDSDGDDDGLDDDRDAVTSYALSPNGVDLIVCTRHGSILRQYSLATGGGGGGGGGGGATAKVRRTLGRSGHPLPVTQTEFHPSGIFFATGSVDGSVRVWDVRGGYATHAFLPAAAAAAAVSSLAWHPDSSRLVLAVAREGGSVCLHDLRRPSSSGGGGGGGADVPIARLDNHVSAVTCMAWVGRGGDVFVTAGRDAVINSWSVEEEPVGGGGDAGGGGGGEEGRKKKEKKRRKKGGGGEGGAASSSPPPRTATRRVAYRRIRTLPVYEQVEGMVVLPRYHHRRPDVDRRDIVLATAGSRGVVRIWRARHLPADDASASAAAGVGSKLRPTISDFECVAEQDGSCAFGEERGGYTGLLRTHHGGDAMRSPPHFPPEELVAIDAEHNMTFLNLGRGGDGAAAAAAAASSAKVEVGGKAVLRVDRTIVGHNDEILDLKVLPPPLAEEAGASDDPADAPMPPPRRIAVATNSAQVRIFELGTYSCTVLDGHTGTVLSLDASPCGRYVATSGKDKTMRIWSVRSGKCVGVATGHTEAVGAVAMSRRIGRYEVGGRAAANGGGAFAFTASKDRTLKRWALPGFSSELNLTDDCDRDRDDDEQPLPLRALGSARAHEKDINIVTVAPNDSLAATGSQDKTVKLWNVADLTLRGTLKGHKRGVWDCQFSPHDRVLATCSGDRTVKLWSLGDLSCVRTFQGHAASSLRVRFLSGGLQLVSSGADGLVKLWTIRTNECEATMDGHSDKIWALDLSPDGGALVSGGADSKIIVWKDTTKELEDAKRDEEEKNILMEQRLVNHLHFKEYEKALEIALELDKPRQALKVLTAIIENDTQRGQNSMTTLQRHVKSWPMSRASQVLRYCRDWNTRARNSHVAMLTIKAVVSSIPAHTLAAADGVPEILAGVTPYAERHFQRLDRLYASSYLLDYSLFSMGSLDDGSAQEYADWEAKSKLILPPKQVDGRVQVGGAALVGMRGRNDDGESSDDEVMTVGDSDSSSESESDEEGKDSRGAGDVETSSSSS